MTKRGTIITLEGLNVNPVHQSDPVQFATGDRIEVIKPIALNCRGIGARGTIARVGRRPNGVFFADIKWDDGVIGCGSAGYGYLYENLLINNCRKIQNGSSQT